MVWRQVKSAGRPHNHLYRWKNNISSVSIGIQPGSFVGGRMHVHQERVRQFCWLLEIVSSTIKALAPR